MAKTLTPPEALHRSAALCSSSEHCIAEGGRSVEGRGKSSPDGVSESRMPEQSSNDSFKKDSSMKEDTPLLSPKTNSVFPGGDE